MLQYFDSYHGVIHVGNKELRHISPSFWRSHCSTVLQESYIFNDTIENNIAFGANSIDMPQLLKACDIANILDFIQTLPQGLKTKIGAEGHGLSQGQKQRILIARAIYKKPTFIFLDEATNALDSNNEKAITEKLDNYFNEPDETGDKRTVVIVAHRLSTVQNADNIIVMKDGRIAEQGNHEQLTKTKGYYYQLVKNQLELGV
jgi:ATP-binding cassette, subfamily B, bacterial